MNAVNIARALAIAFDLLTAAQATFTAVSALIGKARAEGRDVTDAELAELTTDRKRALDAFKAQVGD